MKTAIGTRFFGQNPAKDLPRLEAFIEGARASGVPDELIFIAINNDADQTGSLTYLRQYHPKVSTFAVTPWGKFVQPLNALVLKATAAGADTLLLASAEFPPLLAATEKLLSYLNEKTLMVGARLPEHEFLPGGNERARGMTVPWNTYNLLNLPLIARTGFVLVGDGPFDSAMAGVEELATAAVHQQLWGVDIKLVHIPEFYKEWNTAGWDAERHALHAKKITSKNARPEAQLAFAGLTAPHVQHIQ